MDPWVGYQISNSQPNLAVLKSPTYEFEMIRPKTEIIKKSPLVLPIPFSHANIGVSWEMTPEWKREEGG